MKTYLSILPVIIYLVLMGGISAQEPLRIVPYKPDPPMAIDGGLGDWQALPSSQGNSANASAFIHAAWREESLFIAVESKRVGMQRILLAVECGTDHARSLFLFDPDPSVPVVTAVHPENGSVTGIQAAWQKTESSRTLEAAIPWVLLGLDSPKTGSILSLGIHCTQDGMPGEVKTTTAILTESDGSLKSAPPAAQLFTEEEMAPGGRKGFAFEAPPCPEGLRAVLSLRARLAFQQVAGYCPLLRVTLNDTPVGGDRMRNRPLRLKARGGDIYSMAAGDLLSVYYSPDFVSPDTHSHYGPIDAVQVCLIQLDVTDILAPGANRVTLKHDDPSIPCALVMADALLQFLPPAPPPKQKLGPPSGLLSRIAPSPVPGTAFKVNPVSESGLEVQVGDESFLVESRFSTPAPAWVTGENPWFKRERAVEITDEAVIVRDAFTNLTDEPLALMRHNEINLEGRIEKVWLAGLERADKAGHSTGPANPTTFAATSGAGIGLLPLDDISRIHTVNQAQKGVVTLSDVTLVLRPGASYTAEWAIIPTLRPDYWTFINAARRLYDANFLLDGAFVFLRADPKTDAWTDAQTADFLRFKSAKYVCASISYPLYEGCYPHGTAFQHITHDNFRASFSRWKTLMPDIRTMVYFHCFIDVTPEGPERFADARLLLSNGVQANYGKDHDRIFIPTMENTYGHEVGRNVEVVLDEIGADGVYWDEHEYSRLHYTYSEPWDGFSGDMDAATMQVSRLKSSVTLLSEPWRLALAQKILERGPLIGNGPPFTRAMAALKFPCFVETGSITRCTQAHLYSPIALGDHLTEASETDAYRTMLAALDLGCVYHWYNDLTVIPTHPHLVQYMYPVTPLEIHAGYIIGKERIITKVSGAFGWNDDSEHEVHVFDDAGRETEKFEAPRVDENGKIWTELRLAEDWSAVIVRVQ